MTKKVALTGVERGILMKKKFEVLALLTEIRLNLNTKLKNLMIEEDDLLKKETKIIKRLNKIENVTREDLVSLDKTIDLLKSNLETPHLIKPRHLKNEKK